jgi:transcriptional regulator with XRE-family HTH domain
MTRQQPRRPPRDEEEAAAFQGLGQAITVIRERRGMSRDELASKAEMTVPELEAVERGELDEWWGGLRMIAKAFDMPFPALMMEVEEPAPGKASPRKSESPP